MDVLVNLCGVTQRADFAKCAGLCPRQLTDRPGGPFPVRPAATATSPPQLFHTAAGLLTLHFCVSQRLCHLAQMSIALWVSACYTIKMCCNLKDTVLYCNKNHELRVIFLLICWGNVINLYQVLSRQ